MMLVSACLAGCACRYDGKSCSFGSLPEPRSDGEIKLVCPEMAGGLPTPREPAEIQGGTGADVLEGKARVITVSGKDVTDAFLKGAYEALRIAKEQKAFAVMLKQKSPSCGCGQIYDGTYSGTIRAGDGVTAALLRKEGFKIYTEQNPPLDWKQQ
ncbi:MAG: DUF523 domain-containing protein [Bacillus sp. (in: firmicutes)]